jgi:hypothetical protein
VRGIGHGLHAASDDDLELTGTDQLICQGDGVESRQAYLVDGQSRHVHPDSGFSGGLTRSDLPGASLQHVTHNHVVDLLRTHAGLVERAFDGDAAEVRGRETFQRAQQPPHRGASSRNDHISSHADLLSMRSAT